MITYLAPYTYNEIVENYGEQLAQRLAKDPVHKYRMDSGIELVHQEPTIEELDRIYANYRAMPVRMKRLSNAKSKQLFGINNRDHYYRLREEY